MCGISVLWVKHDQVDRFRPEFDAACNAVSYRGLDQAARITISLSTHKIFAFHSRLSIRGGLPQHQPVTNSDGSVGFVFNGELYNLEKVAEAWGYKERFYDNLTEIGLLQWLCERHWQERDRWVAMLDGMFAFVAWHEDELLIEQDGWQIKPLYIRALEEDAGLLIASHPESIVPSRSLQAAEIKHYLHYRYMPTVESKWEKINQQPSPDEPTIAYDTTTLDYLLSENLELITKDQQQFGLFLSGGVDSTLIAAHAQKLGINHRLIGYTAVDETQAVTEDANYASQAAMQFQIPWKPVFVGPELLLELEDLMKHFETPIADVSGLLTYAICKQANRDGIKVMLSGAGADELFCGYNRHQVVAELESGFGLKHKALDAAIKSGLASIEMLLPDHPYKSRLLASQHFSNSELIDLVRIQATWPNQAFTVQGKIAFVRTEAAGTSALQKLVDDDRLNYLTKQLMPVTDRASMLAQVEVRLPYLLNEITSFALSYPAEKHVEHGPKWLLRSQLTELGGGLFANRKKEGFGINIDAWLRHPIGNKLLEDMTISESYLWQVVDRQVVTAMVSDHLKETKSWGHQLFILLTFYCWERSRT